ncbi:Aste57867_602 [Aphanomyces stellatus]|uniref:Aste57867_602 protein n=1 Tax=Aphanomyces stellatus TaxID=120398 RepID=A0A485K688_9STRA|nr:hypothetical protein As57867_000601 [Aphanomyces stellatus]VFT77827.1 Aste57867_602 [Aphanomyces stellatus]
MVVVTTTYATRPRKRCAALDVALASTTVATTTLVGLGRIEAALECAWTLGVAAAMGVADAGEARALVAAVGTASSFAAVCGAEFAGIDLIAAVFDGAAAPMAVKDASPRVGVHGFVAAIEEAVLDGEERSHFGK